MFWKEHIMFLSVHSVHDYFSPFVKIAAYFWRVIFSFTQKNCLKLNKSASEKKDTFELEYLYKCND